MRATTYPGRPTYARPVERCPISVGRRVRVGRSVAHRQDTAKAGRQLEDNMVWILLMGAIAAEVIATSALKLSDGLTRLLPSVVVALGYILSFVLLAQALKQLQV